MSANLIERIKKARQTTVKIGDITLICRRPTNLEMLEMRNEAVTQGDILKRFVDGWEGMTELHLTSSGSAVPVEFSRELFAEWVSDHPEAWGEITEAVVTGYKLHQERQEESLKNSKPGSEV